MASFPDFIRSPKNRVAPASRYTEDIEGHPFDGADGSQAALWSCRSDRVSDPYSSVFECAGADWSGQR